jgi:hypothetical protein
MGIGMGRSNGSTEGYKKQTKESQAGLKTCDAERDAINWVQKRDRKEKCTPGIFRENVPLKLPAS